jgi:hypothetical protein
MILPLLACALFAPITAEGSEPVETSEPIETSVVSSEAVSTVPAETTSGSAIVPEIKFDFGTWLRQTFSPEVIAAIVSAITAVGALLKMASVLKNLAKDKVKSAEEILNIVLNAIKSETKEEFLANVQPLVNEIYGFKGQLAEMMKVFALMQENSPEARVAILEILSKLGNEQVATLSDEAKVAIAKEVASIEAKKKETIEKVEKATKEAGAAYDGTSI